MKSRRPSKKDIKAAADRASARSKGEPVEAAAPVDPIITPIPASRGEKDKGGRPPKYKAEYAKQAAKLCALGATDADLADFFGVTTRTIANWSSFHPGFFQAVKTAKTVADQRVVRSLYERAVGFKRDAVKIFQFEGSPVVVPFREEIAPDTTACIFWLKNRDPKAWREKVEHEHGATPAFARIWQKIGKGETVAQGAEA